MASVNKVILLGTFGRDPEVKYLPNGDAVCNFSIATTESWKDKSGAKQEKTEWHNIVCYRKLAEIVGEYMKKGSSIYLEGRLQTTKWTKDGVDRYTTQIVMDVMQMLGGSRNQQSNNQASNQGGYQDDNQDSGDSQRQSSAPKNGGGSNNYEDDIPF